MRAADSSEKIAFLSHVLPPSSSGQAVVLYRLLRDWEPQRYCLISTRDYAAEPESADIDVVTRRLLANYHCLPAESSYRLLASQPFQLLRTILKKAKNIRQGERLPAAEPIITSSTSTLKNSNTSLLRQIKHACHSALRSWDDRMNVHSEVKQRAAAVRAILHKERCTALVVCSGDLIDMPAAFSAAQQARIPCYAYMLDDYPHQFESAWQRQFAQTVGRQIIQRAAGVIVPNEFLARAYREAYGIDSMIVRNPVEDVPVPPSLSRMSAGMPYRIVYTGKIYEAHFDSFVRLAQAIQRFPEGQVELHLYSKSDAAYLAKNGIGHPTVLHASVTNAEALELQRSADLLFLPLAFHSSIPEIIRTSAPGKMGEYLASGRPILAHGPSDSFLSWYCRTHECAAVVDMPNVDCLHRAIVDLMQKPAWVDRLVQNAWHRACEDFHLPTVQRIFNQVFARPAA